MREAVLGFECFGGWVEVRAGGGETAEGALLKARERLLDAHRRLSRFDPASELSRLNMDPRAEVPASPLLRRLAIAVGEAGARSGGLVDGTLVEEIEQAGYAASREPSSAGVAAGAGRPQPAPAGPSERAGWAKVGVDDETAAVIRPAGLRIDGGGLVKGLLADLVGDDLASFPSFAVDCCGDIRLGGTAAAERPVLVEDPTGGRPIAELFLHDGAVATSGVTRRSWLGVDGRPAHQIIDPRSGHPAFTGVVQVTALAPTALLAEVHAKAALLSGPAKAASWLPFGGVVVLDDGNAETIPARSAAAAPVTA